MEGGGATPASISSEVLPDVPNGCSYSYRYSFSNGYSCLDFLLHANAGHANAHSNFGKFQERQIKTVDSDDVLDQISGLSD